MMDRVPVIDVSALRDPGASDQAVRAVATSMDQACRSVGFFTIIGHGIDPAHLDRLETEARAFFALDPAEKAEVAMATGGVAWRGWFPLDGELTSGRPDHKEGLYFGAELAADDPRVLAAIPLHGPNRFPDRPSGLRPAVLDHLADMTALGHDLVRGLALGLALDADWFHRHLTAEPLVLLRIFRYPPLGRRDPVHGDAVHDDRWSVGEHTDYGLLTVLAQDATGGLEVRGPHGWMAVDPEPSGFVVNLGDMLERMTGGRYRSTPHRVRNTGDRDRLSIPFFFDPSWHAEVRPMPPRPDTRDGADEHGDLGDPGLRWDGVSPLDWSGTYGEYLLDKVSRVFPVLGAQVLGSRDPRA